jgi:predicted MPP superfamily phosphohydrolase
VRTQIGIFVAIVQSILLFGHFVIYETWIELWGAPEPRTALWLRIVLGILSLSFIAASLVGFRYSNAAVRAFYRVAAGWLGFMGFLFFASGLCWIVYGAAWAVGWRGEGRAIVATLFGAAILTGVYGIVNAARTRVKRFAVKLASLPESWRGRTAVLVSDTHLGHVRSFGFARKIVAMVSQLRPDVVFIAGDLYDGGAADLVGLAKPLSELSAPLGVFFVAGNHEEFTDRAKYLAAVAGAGVRVLNNEKAIVDGMQIVGVPYHATVNSEAFSSALAEARINRNRASILLSHAPHRLEIPERAGISLQLSGHTHHGQMIPFTWIVDRIFGPFAYGLHRFGNMMVYTSCGAGTWGPPMRVGTGTDPEIVVLRFE